MFFFLIHLLILLWCKKESNWMCMIVCVAFVIMWVSILCHCYGATNILETKLETLGAACLWWNSTLFYNKIRKFTREYFTWLSAPPCTKILLADMVCSIYNMKGEKRGKNLERKKDRALAFLDYFFNSGLSNYYNVQTNRDCLRSFNKTIHDSILSYYNLAFT